jgi:hypothetical protein
MLDTLDTCKKGGKREGAGRKPASYKTTTIAFRVRVEWAEQIKTTVKNAINELRNKK